MKSAQLFERAIAYLDGKFAEGGLDVLRGQDMALAVPHHLLCFLDDLEHFGFQIVQQQLSDVFVDRRLPRYGRFIARDTLNERLEQVLLLLQYRHNSFLYT